MTVSAINTAFSGVLPQPGARQQPVLPSTLPDTVEIRFAGDTADGDEMDRALANLLSTAEAETRGDFAPFETRQDYVNWLSRVFMVNTAGHINTEDAMGNPVPFSDFVVDSRLEDAINRAFIVARARVLDVPDFEGKGPELDPYELPWETLAEMMGLDTATETEDSTFNALQTKTIDALRDGLALLDDEDRKLFDEVVVPLVGGYPQEDDDEGSSG